jgi:hypothetical protein
MPDIRANAMVPSPARKQTVRLRGTRFAGWARFTWPTSRTQTTAADTRARSTTGSIVQPRSRFAADGGSAGTAPWALATPDAASAASPPIVSAGGRHGARRGGTGLASPSSSHATRSPRPWLSVGARTLDRRAGHPCATAVQL